jgi:hypothetical protein
MTILQIYNALLTFNHGKKKINRGIRRGFRTSRKVREYPLAKGTATALIGQLEYSKWHVFKQYKPYRLAAIDPTRAG